MAFYNRGNAYRVKGENDIALVDFSEAIRLNPRYTNAFINRGVVYQTKGDYAFITHMVETALADEGRVGVIVPHGVLFRAGSEGLIRKKMIDENLLSPPTLPFPVKTAGSERMTRWERRGLILLFLVVAVFGVVALVDFFAFLVVLVVEVCGVAGALDAGVL